MKSRAFKLLSLCVATSAIILFSASCTRSSEKSGEVLLLLKTLDNPFFESIKQGVLSKWSKSNAEIDLTIQAGAQESDVSTQQKSLDLFIAKTKSTAEERSGVILTPSASGKELVRHVKKLNDQSVPVVLVDTLINSSALAAGNAHYDAFIGSSNEEGGRLAASLIKKYLPSGGRVLLLGGVQGHESAVARKEGFLSELGKVQDANFELIERTANWRRDEARKVVEALLALGERIDGIFAANDEMALGAYEAWRTSPRKKDDSEMVIIGFDAIESAVEAINACELTATIAQDPYGMGVAAVETLEAIWAGKDYERNQIIPVKPIEKDCR